MAGWANTSVLGLTLLVTGCAGLPAGTYYPDPRDSNTTRVATTLYRAASAAGQPASAPAGQGLRRADRRARHDRHAFRRAQRSGRPLPLE